jgi:hypothetical protein
MAKDSTDFHFELDMAPLLKGITVLDERTDRGVAGVVEYWDSRIESHMKINAPWKDRTGNARIGLFAKAGHERGQRHWIDLGHRVPYGIWLEIRWEGRYAIVFPTLIMFGPRIMKTLNKLFARLGTV